MNIHFTFTDENGSKLTYLNGMIHTEGPIVLTKNQTLDLASALIQYATQNWTGELRG